MNEQERQSLRIKMRFLFESVNDVDYMRYVLVGEQLHTLDETLPHYYLGLFEPKGPDPVLYCGGQVNQTPDVRDIIGTLGMPEAAKSLGPQHEPDLNWIDALARSRVLPFIMLVVGKSHETGEDLVVLYSPNGINPESALAYLKDSLQNLSQN